MNYTLLGSNSTQGSPVSPLPVYYDEPNVSKVVRYVIYTVLFIFAVLGNITVCLVPLRHRRMRTFTYYLITNLAVSDIGTMLCMPPLLVYEFQGTWKMGSIMCKLVNPSLTMFGLVTTNTLVAIAIDRFIALVFPFKRRPQRKETILVVSLSWLVAFGSVLPSAGARKLVSYGVEVYCLEIFPGPLFDKSYTVFMYLLNNALPIFIISCLYAKIVFQLKGITLAKIFKRKNSKSEDGLMGRSPTLTSDAVYEKQKHEREKKFTKMLLSVVIVFIVCYVPVQTYFLLAMFIPSVLNWEYTGILYVYLYLLMWFPNALNPLLYGSMNEHYAKAYKICLRCSPGSHNPLNNSQRCGSYSKAPTHNGTMSVALTKDTSL